MKKVSNENFRLPSICQCLWFEAYWSKTQLCPHTSKDRNFQVTSLCTGMGTWNDHCKYVLQTRINTYFHTSQNHPIFMNHFFLFVFILEQDATSNYYTIGIQDRNDRYLHFLFLSRYLIRIREGYVEFQTCQIQGKKAMLCLKNALLRKKWNINTHLQITCRMNDRKSSYMESLW